MWTTITTDTHKGEAYCALHSTLRVSAVSWRIWTAQRHATSAKFRSIVGSTVRSIMTKLTSCLLLTALASAFFVGVAPQECHAQDPEFSQFYSNPLLLNPAFAGTARGPRVVMSHRNQWPAMSGAFVTQAVGYDQHFSSIQGGLGLVVMNDQAGQNTLTTTRITGMYSYQQVITRTPADRWGEIKDKSGIAVFLASAASDFVTGTAIPIDGGFSASI